MDYDGSRTPDPTAWLALDEDERKAVVQEHHERSRDAHAPVPSPQLHAAMHVVAETQIAANDPPEARNALERLVREGLHRHEAVHAVASVSADELFQVMHENRPYDAERLARGLDALTAEAWVASTREPPEDEVVRPFGTRPRKR
jgi:hypothetical protein